MDRRLAALLLAIVVATGLLASPAGATDVRAAAPGLTIVSDARYDVQPESHRVRVTLDMVLKNRLSDTGTQRFYFDHAFLSVLSGASAPELSWSGSGAPRASVSKATSASTILRLDLGARLYSGKSATYRLVFDIVDTGGAAGRGVRVGDSLVSFPVWAFASDSTAGSTVKVVFPAGYEVRVASGDMPAPTTAADGTIVLETGSLKTPLTFFAHLVADRQGALVDTTEGTTSARPRSTLTISSWADDAAWGQRVGDLAGRALPVLAERIGLAVASGRRPGHPRDGRTVERRLRRPVRSSGRPHRCRVRRDRRGRPPRSRALPGSTARCWPTAGRPRPSRRTTHGRAPDLKVKASPARPRPSPPGPRGGPDPAQRLGRARGRGTADRGLRLCGLAGPRPRDRRARRSTTGCGRCGPMRPRGPGPTSRQRPPARRRDRRPRTVDGPPDWRGLLDLLDEHARRSLDDLWRTWVARDGGPRPARRPPAARARYAAVRRGGRRLAVCPSPSATRCGPGGSTTRTGC